MRAAAALPQRSAAASPRPSTIAAMNPALNASPAPMTLATSTANAGLWSTADDLLRFGRAWLRGGELDGERILAPAFVALATREVTVDGLGRAEDRLLDEHYAIGWGKPGPTNPASPAAFGHSGASGTRLFVDPAHDLVIVYLSGAWGLPGLVMDDTVNAVYAAVR